MKIQARHSNFIMPTRGSHHAGGYDIYMPEGGVANGKVLICGLGFAAEVPEGYVALILPRSGAGFTFGVEVNNTCGVIDSDYRGEWKAAIRTKDGNPYSWSAGDRVLQFLLVPVMKPDLEQVEELSETLRCEGGFGSTGK